MRILAVAFAAVMVVVDQVQQQLSQLIDIPSVATTTYSMAVIMSTFLFLMLFGGIIYKKKKKMTAFLTNSAVEGRKMSVDGAISASDVDITSDGGSVQEVDDAMTKHSDSMTSRYVVFLYIIFNEVHYYLLLLFIVEIRKR